MSRADRFWLRLRKLERLQASRFEVVKKIKWADPTWMEGATPNWVRGNHDRVTIQEDIPFMRTELSAHCSY